MTILDATSTRPEIVYPETDGAPIAENTLQFDWIDMVKGGLDHLFADRPDVFVAGDLFWYPVEGHPEVVAAPDAMVAFGRPKGHRPSYMQWVEGNVAPQVVFEILSHANRPAEMARKLEFYRRYGVEEYYVVDPNPDHLEFAGYVRAGDRLAAVPAMDGHVSPRLGVRFESAGDGLRIVRPDGQPLVTYGEMARQRDADRRRAERERDRAERERERAERERERAELERERAERATAEVERLRQRLRSLGQDPPE